MGVVAANWQYVLGISSLCFFISGPVLFLASFHQVRWLSRSRGSPPPSHLASLRGWVAAILAIVTLVLSVCLRQRWVTGWQDPRWPRKLPYPDLFLQGLHDWWDRLHPAGPYLKMCGEYYAVLMGVSVVALVACVLSGLVCGYAFRNAKLNIAAQVSSVIHNYRSRDIADQ